MNKLASALCALLLLSGCGRDGHNDKDAPPVQVATQPLSFTQKSADAGVSLTLDRRIAAWPALHQRLYSEGRRELTDFLQRAGVDRQALLKEGGESPPYSREVTWTVTVDTGRLVSLRQSWADYSGGAHGSYGSETLLWSKAQEAPVLPSGLFRGDADHAALDRMLCDAVRAAKAERLGAQAAGAADWTCPTWRDSRMVLAPSTVAGKSGGLTFLFDPYVLGPYAEGEYEVTLPQAQLRGVIVPGYLGEFEGAPPPTDTREG